MEPKTKLQKKVVELSKKLRPITSAQKQYAFSKCHKNHVVRSRNTLYCLECGHKWNDKFKLYTALIGNECPACHKALTNLENYRTIHFDYNYFAILTTAENMQVMRMFQTTRICKKQRPAKSFIQEVMQHWIGSDGSTTTLSKKVLGISQYYDKWVQLSFLEIRTATYNSGLRFKLEPEVIYPRMKILPEIKRNGFKGQLHDIGPQRLFPAILSDYKAEYLLKTGNIQLLDYHIYKHEIDDLYFPSLRICIRNNYQINDPSMWIDYINLLNQFHKDTRSPKLICPENLQAEHDRYHRKKMDILNKIEFEKRTAQAKKENRKFKKAKKKFFDLTFKEQDLTIKPLQSVEEFVIEGNELHHCVFSGGYYEKQNSLILSAQINKMRIETIEFSLKNLEIVQSRGLQNKATEHHDRIVNLLQKNIPAIVQRANA